MQCVPRFFRRSTRCVSSHASSTFGIESNNGQVGWNREYIDLLSNSAISRSYLDLLAHRAVLAEIESLAIDRLDRLIGAAMVTIFRRGIRKTWNGANPFDRRKTVVLPFCALRIAEYRRVI